MDAMLMDQCLIAVRAGDAGALSELLTTGANANMTAQVFESVC